ncbi:LysR family transcriptional regulator [Brenneria populi subsp. brevivirga]|uniref:LysR family transcriptional regulator n=1 Tax=Brenneria populi TaxID=1505588 RepID=UPI002E171DC5|nr:LysR family transcriptional regulator [Brenneria populi subsp. brevivirga]
MNIKQLQYFCKVVEKKGISQAANELQIGATAISMQIASLEKELNSELFNRNTRPMTLTKLGGFLYQRAQEIIFNIDSLQEDVYKYRNSESTSLNVGGVRSIIFNLLPETIKRFTNLYGHIDVNLQETLSAYQIKLLSEHIIDIGILREMEESDFISDEFVRELILMDPLYAAVPKNHYLTRKTFITLQDFCNSPFISFPGYQKSQFQERILQIFSERGIVPAVSFKARELHSALSFVAAGLGVTLVGKTVIANNRNDIAFLQIEDFRCNSYIYAIYRKLNGNPNIPLFLDIMRNVAQE